VARVTITVSTLMVERTSINTAVDLRSTSMAKVAGQTDLRDHGRPNRNMTGSREYPLAMVTAAKIKVVRRASRRGPRPWQL
jgi:hypothetical protein